MDMIVKKGYKEKRIKDFRINYYLSVGLRLITGYKNKYQTVIFVKNKRFSQCKYLAFNIPTNEVEKYEDIKSIDDMEQYDHSASYNKLSITPKQEFWGHCSNLQAWYENDYDTRLLHRNLAFPLLKKLSEAGDPKAKKVFHDEIAYRFEQGNDIVKRFLLKEHYIECLTYDEINMLIKNASGYIKGSLNSLIRRMGLRFTDNIPRQRIIQLIKERKFKRSPNFFYVRFIRSFSFQQLRELITLIKEGKLEVPNKPKFKEVYRQKSVEYKKECGFYKKLDFWL